MGKATSPAASDASQRITNLISQLPDWRGKTLARLRRLVLEASSDLVEEWKWGTAVWSHHGPVCSAGVFKDHVKLNFFKGASLKDSKRLFNAGLESKAMRAIDFFEGDQLDAPGIGRLIRLAVTLNQGGKRAR